jgi:hypothetical protein
VHHVFEWDMKNEVEAFNFSIELGPFLSVLEYRSCSRCCQASAWWHHDIGFELVAQPDGATIYLMDHDKPMASKGITGKLTVLQGSNKIEADIKEAGDNTLRVLGVKLGKGDKLVAALSNVGGKSMTVRFTIK